MSVSYTHLDVYKRQVYNGGPGHLTRISKPKLRADLREIDNSFFEKYQAVKAGNELDVGKCFTGLDLPR